MIKKNNKKRKKNKKKIKKKMKNNIKLRKIKQIKNATQSNVLKQANSIA